MIVVSNTSPLVNLAAVGQLDLLQRLYDKVVIPQSVHDEIVIAGAGQPGAIEVATFDWIETRQVAGRNLVASLQLELDDGEAEAIALAVELKADLILLEQTAAGCTASFDYAARAPLDSAALRSGRAAPLRMPEP